MRRLGPKLARETEIGVSLAHRAYIRPAPFLNPFAPVKDRADPKTLEREHTRLPKMEDQEIK